MKFKEDIKIVFTSSAYEKLKNILDIPEDIRCCYCERPITAGNVGAIISSKKVSCQNFLCLMNFVNENEREKKV